MLKLVLRTVKFSFGGDCWYFGIVRTRSGLNGFRLGLGWLCLESDFEESIFWTHSASLHSLFSVCWPSSSQPLCASVTIVTLSPVTPHKHDDHNYVQVLINSDVLIIPLHIWTAFSMGVLGVKHPVLSRCFQCMFLFPSSSLTYDCQYHSALVISYGFTMV